MSCSIQGRSMQDLDAQYGTWRAPYNYSVQGADLGPRMDTYLALKMESSTTLQGGLWCAHIVHALFCTLIFMQWHRQRTGIWNIHDGSLPFSEETPFGLCVLEWIAPSSDIRIRASKVKKDVVCDFKQKSRVGEWNKTDQNNLFA